MKEQVVQFGPERGLLGIVSEPPGGQPGPAPPALILLNSGLLHRVGPNRLHVTLARRLATAGHVALRFDFSGVGDSPPSGTQAFEDRAVQETVQAMNLLAHRYGVERFLLLGNCSGASIAALSTCADNRVAGAVLVNFAPGIGSQTPLGTTYYRSALLNPQKWWRFLRGRTDYRSILRVFGSRLRCAARGAVEASGRPLIDQFSARMAGGCRVLLIYSGFDPALERLRLALGKQLDRLLSSGSVQLEVVRRADHLFTRLAHQRRVIELVEGWVCEVSRL